MDGLCWTFKDGSTLHIMGKYGLIRNNKVVPGVEVFVVTYSTKTGLAFAFVQDPKGKIHQLVAELQAQ